MSTPTDAGLEQQLRWPRKWSLSSVHSRSPTTRRTLENDLYTGRYENRPVTFPRFRDGAKEPAQEPVADPSKAFGAAISALPALALAAGCFVAIKVTELKE